MLVKRMKVGELIEIGESDASIMYVGAGLDGDVFAEFNVSQGGVFRTVSSGVATFEICLMSGRMIPVHVRDIRTGYVEVAIDAPKSVPIRWESSS
jgi:hypothetical protein